MDNIYPDWFYLKMYVEPPFQNRFLLDYVYPVVDHYSHCGGVEKWFFIRYSDKNEAELSMEKNASNNEALSKITDQGYHLRVRLQILPAFFQAVQEAFTHNLKQACIAGYCKRWEEAFYIPEMNRYGGTAGIDLAHEVFYLNSRDIITLFSLYSGNATTELFIQLGDELLQNLGLDEKARMHLYFRRFQWFVSAYHLDATDYEHLEKLYLKMRQRLEAEFAQTLPNNLIAGQFLQNSRKLGDIGAEFSRLEKDKRLTFPKIDILAALHHMHCNRAGYSSFKELSTLYCLHRWLKDCGFS
jgi:thiopeptide-type bacteriocin biosynthesis protein